EQRVRGVIAERLREGDLLLCGGERRRPVWRTAPGDELIGQTLGGGGTLLGSRLRHNDQRRPAEAVDAQKACAEGLKRLAGQRAHVAPEEQEGAGNRPFPGL